MPTYQVIDTQLLRQLASPLPGTWVRRGQLQRESNNAQQDGHTYVCPHCGDEWDVWLDPLEDYE
jgi:hypothetical protein